MTGKAALVVAEGSPVRQNDLDQGAEVRIAGVDGYGIGVNPVADRKDVLVDPELRV